MIAAAGSVDHDEVLEMVRAADAARTPSQGGPPDWAAIPEPRFERSVCFLEKDTEQYHLCVGGPGIPRDDERRFALRVLEGVLGGTSSSRLFQEIRERRGLAYSVFSFSNLYAHTGEVGVYLGTRPENLEEALGVLARELLRSVEDPASEEELVRSRENLKGRVVLALESTGARMSRLGSSTLSELPILSVDEMIERIDAVGIEQLRELAESLFTPSRLSVACVGPDEDVFRRAIEPLGAVPAAAVGGRAAAQGRRLVIRVAVAGAAGRMGQAVCAAVDGAGDMELSGRADPLLGTTLEDVLAGAEVVVDFTRPDTALANALACVEAGVHVVIGTTGFDPAPLGEARPAQPGARANVLIAPNFAIGAVLMMRFAAEAARHMAKAEIVELHHDGKLDAPSGTAARTAELMAEASGGPPPPIHSVRLPGLVAHQEVILGDLGQTLTIRHDTLSREAFMPGVLLAVRSVAGLEQSPLVGLENLLFSP